MYKSLNEYKKNENLYLEFEKTLIENSNSTKWIDIDKQLSKLRKRLDLNIKKQLKIDIFVNNR